MKKTPSRFLQAAVLVLAALLYSSSAVAHECHEVLYAAVSGDGTVIKVDLRTFQYNPILDNLNIPYGVVADKHGSVFAPDTGNNVIKRIYPNVTPIIVWSNLSYPSGLAVGRNGNILVADYGSGCFLELDGMTRSTISCGLEGAVSVRRYWNPSAWDGGTQPRLLKYVGIWRGGSPGGVALFSQNADGTWTNRQTVATNLSYPYDAASDRAGNLFVSELGFGRIIEFPSATGGLVSTNPVVFAKGLSPMGLVFDGTGNLYEADYGGGSINKFILTNGVLNSMPIAVLTNLNLPTYLAFAPPPIVDIHRAASNVVLEWPDAIFTLQSAPMLTGTFTNVPGATSPYTNPISGGTRFFRLGSN
jgi:hypothetical protein